MHIPVGDVGYLSVGRKAVTNQWVWAPGYLLCVNRDLLPGARLLDRPLDLSSWDLVHQKLYRFLDRVPASSDSKPVIKWILTREIIGKRS
nr:hypothetical protein Q903MT_gene1950 [Picea sitchensis]